MFSHTREDQEQNTHSVLPHTHIQTRFRHMLWLSSPYFTLLKCVVYSILSWFALYGTTYTLIQSNLQVVWHVKLNTYQRNNKTLGGTVRFLIGIQPRNLKASFTSK